MSTNYEKLAEVLKHENDVLKHENKQLEEKYQNSCRKWRTAFDTMHRRAMTAEKESTRVKELMASQAESTPALTYGTDVDNGLVEFFVNGKLLTEWTFEDDPELSFYEFKKVYEAGWENAVNQVKQLEFSHGLIKICLDEKFVKSLES